MSTESRARIEDLEAERLGLCGGDDLPNINAHGVKDDFEFIDESDIHRAISILQDFARLRHAGAGDADNPSDDRLIEGGCQVAAGVINGAYDFGNRARGEVLVTR